VLLVVLCLFFLLSGSRVRVGVAVGLKKLVIGGFLFVFGPCCFVLCVGVCLGWLPVIVDVVGEVVEVVVGRWGDVMVDVAPTGKRRSGYSFFYSA